MNASTAIKNMIKGGPNQEKDHFKAGGIFIYSNPNLGRTRQPLNQKNVNDALEKVPTITRQDKGLDLILGGEKNKQNTKF